MQASELGIVTQISEPPLDTALAMAATMAAKSPGAIRFGKQLFETSWHADPATGLKLEEQLQRQLIGSHNQVESVKANFENRAPQFMDPD